MLKLIPGDPALLSFSYNKKRVINNIFHFNYCDVPKDCHFFTKVSFQQFVYILKYIKRKYMYLHDIICWGVGGSKEKKLLLL